MGMSARDFKYGIGFPEISKDSRLSRIFSGFNQDFCGISEFKSSEISMYFEDCNQSHYGPVISISAQLRIISFKIESNFFILNLLIGFFC